MLQILNGSIIKGNNLIFENPMDNEEKHKADVQRIKIHFFYVATFLVSLIILLATVNWTKLQGFTDYLTAAGTMVSIVLGVLAIIYSFVSGDSISKSIGNVVSAANELNSARKEFASVLHSAAEITDVSRESSAELSHLLSAVQKEVQELKSTSAQLSQSTEGIAKTVGQIPERFDKLDIRLEESLKKTRTNQIGSVKQNIPVLKKMLNYSSNYGRAILYASALSKETGKQLHFKAPPFLLSSAYCHGFIGGASAADVLDYDLVDYEELIFKIKDFPLSSAEVLDILKPLSDQDNERARGLKKILSEVDEVFKGISSE